MPQDLPAAPPTAGPTADANPAAGAAVFVYGMFSALLAVSLAVVWLYGHNVPWGEDWLFMTALTGAEPLTVGWLWEQLYEHRWPLPRLLMVALFAPTGDLRAAMYFNVLALGLACFGLIRVAARVRGRMSYADAFLPLILLQPAHAQSSLWHQMVTATPAALLTLTLLGVIVRRDSRLMASLAVVAGVALSLLPLSGARGLPIAIPLFLWLGYTAAFVWYPRDRRATMVLLAFASLGFAGIVAYFATYTSPDYMSTTADFGIVVDVALQFLSNGFGPGTQVLWPYFGYLMALLYLGTLAVLVTPLWQGGAAERARALGLLALMGAMGLLALATGYRRADSAILPGLQWHYVCTATPWVCCAYLAWGLYGIPAVRQFAQFALFTLAALVLGSGASQAIREAIRFHEEPARLEALLEENASQGGLPLSMVMKTHADPHYKVLDPDPMIAALQAMRHAEIGAFRHLRDDTPYRDLPLDPATGAPVNLTALDGKWRGTGSDSGLTFTFDAPKRVAALRLMYEGTTEEGEELTFRVSWWKDGVLESREVQGLNTPSGTSAMMVAWVCDTIDGFTVHPHEGPCTFTLLQATVQLPRPEKTAEKRPVK